MPNTEEQRLDLLENCDLLLNGILAPFEQIDDTPEGRMITQLKWLKERAENHDLPLPVAPEYLSTIRYIYTDGELCRHASNPNNQSSVDQEVESPMERIIALAKYGHLLYKSEYKPYVIRCIDALMSVLTTADRPLSQYEKGFVTELDQIKNDFMEEKIVPPLGGCAQYNNLIHSEFTIKDIPNAKKLFRDFFNLIFSGTRPDTWLTPELADQETRHYLV